MAKKSVKNTKVRISKFTLGDRIAYLRKKRDLTQGELAKKAKLSQSSIAQIESGKKDPSMGAVQRLADALDVHMALLFAEDDVHIFDMVNLRKKYKSVEDLNETLYRAVGEVVRFARDIGW